jgi:Rrf2 family iron-sulfur cluster assembly transcriptional regulator
MRVGTKGRYAVVALVDVALNGEKGPVALGEVAQRQQISLSYLEQLFAMLRRAGLVVASRGPGGGYRLQRPANEISLAEVFGAVEEGSGQAEGGRDWSAGPAAQVWAGLDQQIAAYLSTLTLADAAQGQSPAFRNTSTGQPARVAPGLSADVKLA